MSPTSPRPPPTYATARFASSAWSSLGGSGEPTLRRVAGDGPAEPGPSRPREVLAPRDHSHRFADADYYHHVSFPPHQSSIFREVLQLLSNRCYTVLVTNKGEKRRGWFVLIYKLPAEPTRLRASVWRKLKAAGAVYLQNGVAALPEDA